MIQANIKAENSASKIPIKKVEFFLEQKIAFSIPGVFGNKTLKKSWKVLHCQDLTKIDKGIDPLVA